MRHFSIVGLGFDSGESLAVVPLLKDRNPRTVQHLGTKETMSICNMTFLTVAGALPGPRIRR